MISYTVHLTINRGNGTDYEHATREFQGLAECKEGIASMIDAANKECLEETEFLPSSLIFTIVTH